MTPERLVELRQMVVTRAIELRAEQVPYDTAREWFDRGYRQHRFEQDMNATYCLYCGRAPWTTGPLCLGEGPR
jgi:hypothetical protein